MPGHVRMKASGVGAVYIFFSNATGCGVAAQNINFTEFSRLPLHPAFAQNKALSQYSKQSNLKSVPLHPQTGHPRFTWSDPAQYDGSFVVNQFARI